MIQYFKSLWMRMRKTTGLPGNEVLIPINEKIVIETSVTEKPVEKKKRKYVRKINT